MHKAHREKDVQQRMVSKAMSGGSLGTLGQILFVYGVATLMTYAEPRADGRGH